jgi:hypothetical protein
MHKLSVVYVGQSLSDRASYSCFKAVSATAGCGTLTNFPTRWVRSIQLLAVRTCRAGSVKGITRATLSRRFGEEEKGFRFNETVGTPGLSFIRVPPTQMSQVVHTTDDYVTDCEEYLETNFFYHNAVQ